MKLIRIYQSQQVRKVECCLKLLGINFLIDWVFKWTN